MYKITLDSNKHIISILEAETKPLESYDSIVDADSALIDNINEMVNSGIELSAIILNGKTLSINHEMNSEIATIQAQSELNDKKADKKAEIKENFSNALRVFVTSFGISINATLNSVTILDTLYRHCERNKVTKVTIRDAFNEPVEISVQQLLLAIDEAIGYIQKILADRALAENEVENKTNEAEIESYEAPYSVQKYELVLPTPSVK